ncbi:uncharacterized protein LOC142329169 isoform X27 [Lycorma delicatula]
MSCAINGCSNNKRNQKNLKYFRFPLDEEMTKKWAIYCKKSRNFKTARVCSVHFDESSYEKRLIEKLLQYSPPNVRKLRKDAVPTLHVTFPDNYSVPQLDKRKKAAAVKQEQSGEGESKQNHPSCSSSAPSFQDVGLS